MVSKNPRDLAFSLTFRTHLSYLPLWFLLRGAQRELEVEKGGRLVVVSKGK